MIDTDAYTVYTHRLGLAIWCLSCTRAIATFKSGESLNRYFAAVVDHERLHGVPESMA